MKNKISLILMVLIILPLCAFAQKNEKDKTFHNTTQSIHFYSHQVSMGYGFGTAAKWLDNYDKGIESGHLYGDSRLWGGINAKYLYRYSEKMTFGLSYSYTGMKRDINLNGSLVGHGSVNINIIMPEFKSDWFKSDIFTLYSRATAGVAIATIKDEYLDKSKNNSHTKVSFAFQASPIGFEVGRQFAFYVELGFGYQGIIVTGVRYNF